MIKYKQCASCGMELRLQSFYIDRNSKDGRTSRCVECVLDHQWEYYHRPEVIERQREYQRQYAIRNRKKRDKYMREYNRRPEVLAKRKKYMREYRKAKREELENGA